MSKDKKKKDKGGKKTEKLKALAQNPMVADVVAAALVATAAALKDSKRARALASDVADELTSISKRSSSGGSAMWDLALQIGRQSLDALLADGVKGKAAKKERPAKSEPPAAMTPAKVDSKSKRTPTKRRAARPTA